MAKKYEWSDDQVPTIDIHSTKKHDVLREYIRRYVLIVGGLPFHRRSLTLTLVDAFAGGGLYKKPDGELYFGSPFIFLKSTEEAAAQLDHEKKGFTLNAHYIFLEKEKRYINFLEDSLKKDGYQNQVGKNIHCIHGIFEENIDAIIDHICYRKGNARRCIFLLDQYGYQDVPLSSLWKIFYTLPKAEIILTFAVDFLIDYLCDTATCRETLRRIGFSFDLSTLMGVKSQQEWRSIIQRELYKNIIESSGAKYFTNFFIKSNESHKSYWLLHLSMHPTARDEMQRLHWELKNHFAHEGKAGLLMLGYNPKSDGFSGTQSFLFSNHDKEINHKSLLNEIPEKIPEQGVFVRDFITSQCNHTPSTIEMLEIALKELYSSNELRILTINGKDKKKGAKLNPDDVLRIQKQMYLFPQM